MPTEISCPDVSGWGEKVLQVRAPYVHVSVRAGKVLHFRGSRQWIPGSDPKDLDPGSVRIIDLTITVCRQIHWDYRSSFAKARDPFGSETPYCVGIHRDPISDKRNSGIFCALF